MRITEEIQTQTMAAHTRCGTHIAASWAWPYGAAHLEAATFVQTKHVVTKWSFHYVLLQKCSIS